MNLTTLDTRSAISTVTRPPGIEPSNGAAPRGVRSRALPAILFLLIAQIISCGGKATESPPQAEAPAAEEHAEEETPGVVHLTADQVASLDIRVEALTAGSAEGVLERPATLLFDPDRVAMVGPRIEAKVERVLRDLGDQVQAGDPVAVMSSVELGEAKAQHLALKARLETARAAYERERRLLEDQISSEAEMLEARARFKAAEADVDVIHERLRLFGLAEEEIEAIEPAAGEPLSFFRLRSPVGGVVQQRDITPGQTVGPTDTPIQVVRSDRLWAMIDVYERDVARLDEGQSVSLTVRSLPGRSFEAVTDWISYELDPETRTVRVRAITANPDGVLRAGMFGTARIRVGEGNGYALIPVDAVQTLGPDRVVFVPGEESGGFRAAPVRLGAEGGGMVEVMAGLAPGDSAVVHGAFELMSAATAGGRSAEHGH